MHHVIDLAAARRRRRAPNVPDRDLALVAEAVRALVELADLLPEGSPARRALAAAVVEPAELLRASLSRP
ncbi:MAG TPA: hypothetical protein VFT50_00735 [Baekduia sp.]|nr:hypothetical protein [Baekduia sp.]